MHAEVLDAVRRATKRRDAAEVRRQEVIVRAVREGVPVSVVARAGNTTDRTVRRLVASFPAEEDARSVESDIPAYVAELNAAFAQMPAPDGSPWRIRLEPDFELPSVLWVGVDRPLLAEDGSPLVDAQGRPLLASGGRFHFRLDVSRTCSAKDIETQVRTEVHQRLDEFGREPQGLYLPEVHHRSLAAKAVYEAWLASTPELGPSAVRSRAVQS